MVFTVMQIHSITTGIQALCLKSKWPNPHGFWLHVITDQFLMTLNQNSFRKEMARKTIWNKLKTIFCLWWKDSDCTRKKWVLYQYTRVQVLSTSCLEYWVHQSTSKCVLDYNQCEYITLHKSVCLVFIWYIMIRRLNRSQNT